MATVLLVSGMLLARTLFALNSVDPGYDPEDLLVVNFAIPFQRFAQDDADAQRLQLDGYFQEFVDEIAATPGVRSVAVANNIPFMGRSNNTVEPEGWVPEADEVIIAERRVISDNYLETLERLVWERTR